jgi:hypothetical protein|tara:strand:- start:382 stop:741 length:360 start_codon:yes stop_codon:yes gene_type:complete
MMTEERQKILESLLQREVHITCNNRILRKGKFILYTVKDFYITFLLKNNKDINKTYEIPYPFDMFYEEEKDNIVFDYTINSLSERQDMIDLINTVMSGETNNKLFDSKVNITAISNANE